MTRLVSQDEHTSRQMRHLLGQRLRQALADKEYSMRYLSHVTDITPATISKIASGDRMPGLVTIALLADALDKSLDYFNPLSSSPP